MIRRIGPKKIILILLSLVVLLALSIFADKKAAEVQGPTRMVEGPDGTIYIKIDNQIVHVSPEGDVLSSLDIEKDMLIDEPVVDLFAEPNGNLVVALGESQVLRTFTKEGKRVWTHLREPSSRVNGNHFFKFTKDPVSGTVYVADTLHHRIQIYNSTEIEIRTLYTPAGSAFPIESTLDAKESNLDNLISPERPFFYPNGLLYNQGKVFITDTENHRVVILKSDGTLDSILPTILNHASQFTLPVKVSLSGKKLYIINKGQSFIGGEVISIDQENGDRTKFHFNKFVTPEDVLARNDDVLVSERETLNIYRFTYDGAMLGTFGKPSLSEIITSAQLTHWIFEWTRLAALGAMLIILVGLLMTSRRQRISSEKAGARIYKPVRVLQDLLGPPESARRKILLLLVPGLGQAADGRILRAALLVCVLMLFIVATVFMGIGYIQEPATGLPYFLSMLLMSYVIWIVISLDGIRLSGLPFIPGKTINMKLAVITGLVPLVAVAAGTIMQYICEVIMGGNRDLALSLQKLFFETIVFYNIAPDLSASFAATTTASTIFGWSGAVSGLFAVIAWKLGQNVKQIGLASAIGFFAGMITWTITGVVAGTRFGAMFYMPPLQGAQLGLFSYLYFKRRGIPALVIPVAIAGAWMGYLLYLFSMPILRPIFYGLAFDSGGFGRTNFVVVQAYGISVAILIVLNMVQTNNGHDEKMGRNLNRQRESMNK